MSALESFVSPLADATVKDGAAPLTGRHGLGTMPPEYRRSGDGRALDEILRDVELTADLPLERARTLPAEAYTSKALLEWEVDNVLGAGWVCLAHVSQIPKPGDFINVDVLGEPLIVVHGKDSVVRVLSRVCPHRAMDIMPPGFGYDGHGPAEVRDGSPGCGHTRLFLCPYHHWSFELDGSLKGCPEMQKAEGFVREEIGLKTFRSEVWNGFVFLNLSGDAEPVAQQYAPLAADISAWDTPNMKVVIAKEWDCHFNWKVLVENFMEGYHHLGAHCKTLQPIMPAKHTWTEGERAHSIRVILPYKDEIDVVQSANFLDVPDLPEDQRREMDVYLGQPSFLLFTGPDRVFWYRIDPVAPDRSRLLTTMLVNEDALADADYEAKMEVANKMLVDFHLEDMEVCAAVQRGFYAKGYQRGRLSHLEMPIWLIQRYIAARSRGTYPTSDRPAAPSQR